MSKAKKHFKQIFACGISKPFVGWSSLWFKTDTGVYSFPLSYVESNLPYNLIDMFKSYIETNQSVSRQFDTEGEDIIVSIKSEGISIITYEQEYIFNIDPTKFIRMILSDFQLYSYEWASWMNFECEDIEEEYQKNVQNIRTELTNKILTFHMN